MERGFSIFSAGPVQEVLDRMDRGQLEFRLLDQLHAKIVVGPGAALLVLARLLRDWDRDNRIPREVRSGLLQWSQSIRPEGDLYSSQAQDASRYHLANLARRRLEIAEPLLKPLRDTWRKHRTQAAIWGVGNQ